MPPQGATLVSLPWFGLDVSQCARPSSLEFFSISLSIGGVGEVGNVASAAVEGDWGVANTESDAKHFVSHYGIKFV